MNLKKEVIVVARTANIYTRVDPVVKEQAEEILDQLGIPHIKRNRYVSALGCYAERYSF